MKENTKPTVMLLGGDSSLSLHTAVELSQDLSATIIGIGTSMSSSLLRSRYCEIKDIAPPPYAPTHRGTILQLIHKYRPNMVLPTGYDSVAALDSIRTQVPKEVKLCLPPSRSLEISFDKSKTLAVARTLGIQVPGDYTKFVKDANMLGRDSGDLGQLPFPVFLKAAREVGGRNVVAKVDSSSELWPIYDQLRQESADGIVLVQEYVNGSSYNYCNGFLFINGTVELSFGHEKISSAPRQFGSATRVRVFRDPYLEAMSAELLRELDWNGIALLEYKRRPDGTYVLMEINAKVWGAYALARKSGYHFMSTMVARSLGLPVKNLSVLPKTKGEMAFPLREIAFYLKNRSDESLLKSLAVILRPPCRWDLDFRDLRAWLPPDMLQKLLKISESLERI